MTAFDDGIDGPFERAMERAERDDAAREMLRMLKVAVAVTRDRWTRDALRETQAGQEPRALPDWVPEAEALIAGSGR